MTTKPKIGLFVTGLLEDDYNKTGHLRPQCAAATADLAKVLAPYGEIVNPGFVEYEPDAEHAAEVFNAATVDLIVAIELAYQKGAIPMRTFLATHAPIVVWNTQQIRFLPDDADFDLIMLNSGMCGVPELTSALLRTGIPFNMVSSHVSDPEGRRQIGDWAAAAGVVHRLQKARVGIIGHPYEGMTDLMVDHLSLRDRIGPLCWPIEPEKVAVAAVNMAADKVKALMEQEQGRYRTAAVKPEVFERSARLALALEEVVHDCKVDALATFDQIWLTDPRVGIIPSYGTGRLCSLGVSVAPEADVTTAVAMLILQELAGQSTLVENYVMDFDHSTMILSHDGHGNPALAAKPSDVAIKHSIYYEGVHGFGAGLEFAYAPGEVTLLALIPLGDGEWRLIVTEGESLPMKPRPVSAPQMVFRYASGSIEEYCDNWCLAGSPHHMALAYGRLASKVCLVAELLGIEVIVV